MKIFFSSTFIDKKKLEEEKINYPIKLEYYKIINEDEMIRSEKSKFGISLIKTEYRQNETKVENKTIQYLSNDERKIEDLLKVFKENEVTPISVEDIICDFSRKLIFM